MWRVTQVRIYNESGRSNQWLFWAHCTGNLQEGYIPPYVPSASCSNTGIFCFVTEAQARLLGSASRYSASPHPSLWTESEFLSLTVAYKTLICKRFGNLEKRDQRHLKSNSLTVRSQDPFIDLCWIVFIILTCLKT